MRSALRGRACILILVRVTQGILTISYLTLGRSENIPGVRYEIVLHREFLFWKEEKELAGNKITETETSYICVREYFNRDCMFTYMVYRVFKCD